MEKAKKTSSKKAADKAKNLEILLAEDNEFNQLLAIAILKKCSCNVTTAKNGKEAFDRATGHTFDLILMDCLMPEMDGYQAATQIRAWEKKNKKPKISIIAFTANASQEEKDKCLKAGMDDFITKPITPEALSTAIKKWT